MALRNLEILYLDHNHINKIPEWIGELTALRELHIDGDYFTYPLDKITILPPSIGLLKNLEVLTLKDQVIRALPPSISECTKLKVLDLRNNLLSSLPDEFTLMESLEYLDLKANEIENLPSGFSQLKSLKHLNISYNQPLNLPAAAQQIQHMKQLEVLDISFNQLSPQIYYGLKKVLPDTKIIAKGFNNLNQLGN